MTDQELFNSELLQTPLVRRDNHFIQFVTHYLQTYLAKLRSVEGEFKIIMEERIPIIQELSYQLISVAESYYMGNVGTAYQTFCTGLTAIKQYLWLDNTDVTVYHDERTEDLLREHFFKIRHASGKPYSKKEMFIRPFEQREFINTYRYSIPGLPCLYLSSNVYTAWNELDCPDIKTMQVSRFVLDKSLKRLRFGFNINFWKNAAKNLNEGYREKLYDYLTYFPLHALCNIRVRNHSSVFKPEYIFPQFLMQWVKDEHNIDMVEYTTTKIDSYNKELDFFSYNCRNIAIPAQSSGEEGPCVHLQSKIKFTEPVSWQQVETSYPTGNIPQKIGNKNAFRLMQNMMPLELIKGKSIWYKDTIFGMMEDFIINEMEASFL